MVILNLKTCHFEASKDIITKFKSQALHIIRIKYWKVAGSGNSPSHIPAIWNIGVLLNKKATHPKHFWPECNIVHLQEQSPNFSVTSFISKLYFQSCSVSIRLTGNRRNDTSIWHCKWGSTSMLQNSSQVWKLMWLRLPNLTRILEHGSWTSSTMSNWRVISSVASETDQQTLLSELQCVGQSHWQQKKWHVNLTLWMRFNFHAPKF